MSQPTTPSSPVLDQVQPLLVEVAQTCRQARTADRFLTLTAGLQQSLGRHTITQVLRGLGRSELDWSAAYALFRQHRFDLGVGRRQLLAELLAAHPADAPLPVVVDATHLPRSSKALVGVGLGRCPRNPVWAPGLHDQQRWEGLSGLLPCSARGESRAVPLSFDPAPTPTSVPWPGHPPCPEGPVPKGTPRWRPWPTSLPTWPSSVTRTIPCWPSPMAVTVAPPSCAACRRRSCCWPAVPRTAPWMRCPTSSSGAAGPARTAPKRPVPTT